MRKEIFLLLLVLIGSFLSTVCSGQTSGAKCSRAQWGQTLNGCTCDLADIRPGYGWYWTCTSSSTSSQQNSAEYQCQSGRIYTGEVRDKSGKVIGYHCVKDVSSQLPVFPPQQQGIPIGNAPIQVGNASDNEYVSPGSVSPASSTADLLDPSLRKYKH